jgi:hypothetical protein
MPEGCDYAAFPAFGWGRILTAPRWTHVVERYVSVRLFGVVYLLLIGRYFERRSVSFVRFDPRAVRDDNVLIDVTDDPWAADHSRAVIDEQQRLDAERIKSRHRRRAAARTLFETARSQQREGPR